MEQKSNHEYAAIVSDVSFDYANLKVIDHLSLQIPSGTTFGLLGPNGAGKTTLIRLLVGLLKPKQGKIRILGRALSRKMAHCIGYMPQLQSLYSELSVRQNIDFFAKIYHLTDSKLRAERVEEVIRLIDLWDRRNDSIHKLSGGMKQRVSLACGIVHKPPLLFLDEPTVGLDPELRAAFWEHFTELTKQGTTIVISSHTMCRSLRSSCIFA